MLRIAKNSPGILDLSAIKDEFGLPVTLNGPSHRDVPDHEEDNPILQRVRDMQWVTVARLPIGGSEDPTVVAKTDVAGEPSASEEPVPSEVIPQEEAAVESPSPVEPIPSVDTAIESVTNEPSAETVDDVTKTDGSSKASRKAGRRS